MTSDQPGSLELGNIYSNTEAINTYYRNDLNKHGSAESKVTTPQVTSVASRSFRALAGVTPDGVLFRLPERVRTQLDYKGAFARALLKIPPNQRINAIEYALYFRLDQHKREELIQSFGDHWNQTDLEANSHITHDIASPETMKIFREITQHTDAEIESVLPLSLKVIQNIAQYSKDIREGIPSEDQSEFDLLYSRTLCRNPIQTRIFRKILKLEATERDALIEVVNSTFERDETEHVAMHLYRSAATKPFGRALEYIFWKEYLKIVRGLNGEEREAMGATVQLLKGAELKMDTQGILRLFEEMKSIYPGRREAFVAEVLAEITSEMSEAEKLRKIWEIIVDPQVLFQKGRAPPSLAPEDVLSSNLRLQAWWGDIVWAGIPAKEVSISVTPPREDPSPAVIYRNPVMWILRRLYPSMGRE